MVWRLIKSRGPKVLITVHGIILSTVLWFNNMRIHRWSWGVFNSTVLEILQLFNYEPRYLVGATTEEFFRNLQQLGVFISMILQSGSSSLVAIIRGINVTVYVGGP